MTIDLLLSSLAHTLLGSFHSGHVLPCVGHNAFESPATEGGKKRKAKPTATELVTAVQVFSIPSLRAIVLQQRAPCVVGRAAAYVAELAQFASQHGIARVVVLTSSLAYRQHEAELDAVHPVSYYLIDSNDSSASASSSLSHLLSSTLQWTSLHYNTLHQDTPAMRFDQLGAAEEVDDDSSLRVGGGGREEQKEDSNQQAIQPIPVPGLGITRAFYTLASSSTSKHPFSTVFLHTYINEGANDRDAIMMAQQVYALMFLLQQQSASAEPADKSAAIVDPREVAWRMPSSWSALFGNEPDENLYL